MISYQQVIWSQWLRPIHDGRRMCQWNTIHVTHTPWRVSYHKKNCLMSFERIPADRKELSYLFCLTWLCINAPIIVFKFQFQICNSPKIKQTKKKNETRDSNLHQQMELIFNWIRLFVALAGWKRHLFSNLHIISQVVMKLFIILVSPHLWP